MRFGYPIDGPVDPRETFGRPLPHFVDTTAPQQGGPRRTRAGQRPRDRLRYPALYGGLVSQTWSRACSGLLDPAGPESPTIPHAGGA